MKRILIGFSILLSFSMMLFSWSNFSTTELKPIATHPIDNMPLIHNDPYEAVAVGTTPIEQRGEEVRRWINSGLKIQTGTGSGSGTIIYYNPTDGWAYVQSCGHLWKPGGASANEKKPEPLCEVVTWYHNNKKLEQPRSYQAEIVYYNNVTGQDVSLLRFKPDWTPLYFPIAPEDYELVRGTQLHSVGCDEGREVAHYDVIYIGDIEGEWPHWVTTKNSPRPGRSGGGLISNDEYFIGVCWGTSKGYNGEGNGFFTPLKTIRQYNTQNGYGWLNEVGYGLARKIPIVDRNNPQGTYPKNYIPLPRSTP